MNHQTWNNIFSHYNVFGGQIQNANLTNRWYADLKYWYVWWVVKCNIKIFSQWQGFDGKNYFDSITLANLMLALRDKYYKDIFLNKTHNQYRVIGITQGHIFKVLKAIILTVVHKKYMTTTSIEYTPFCTNTSWRYKC